MRVVLASLCCYYLNKKEKPAKHLWQKSCKHSVEVGVLIYQATALQNYVQCIAAI